MGATWGAGFEMGHDMVKQANSSMSGGVCHVPRTWRVAREAAQRRRFGAVEDERGEGRRGAGERARWQWRYNGDHATHDQMCVRARQHEQSRDRHVRTHARAVTRYGQEWVAARAVSAREGRCCCRGHCSDGGGEAQPTRARSGQRAAMAAARPRRRRGRQPTCTSRRATSQQASGIQRRRRGSLQPGGYHPVRIGDVLHRRLGHQEAGLGAARCSSRATCSCGTVALKVVKSEKHYTGAEDEIKLLRCPPRGAAGDVGRSRHPAWTAVVHGPNGTHVCMVFGEQCSLSSCGRACSTQAARAGAGAGPETHPSSSVPAGAFDRPRARHPRQAGCSPAGRRTLRAIERRLPYAPQVWRAALPRSARSSTPT